MNDLNVSTIGMEVESALPVLPLKNTVIYPEQTSVLAVGRASALAAIKAASDGDQLLIAVAQRDPQEQSPGPGDLHDVACLARVQRVEQGEDGVRVIVQGIQRIQLLHAVDSTATYLRMRYAKLPAITLETAAADTTRAEALARDNLTLARKLAVAYDVANRLFSNWWAQLPIPSYKLTVWPLLRGWISSACSTFCKPTPRWH